MALVISENLGMTAYRAGSNAASGALSRIRGAVPSPTYTASGNTGLVTWDDNGAGGTFQVSGVNNVNAVYTPRNKTQNVVITATEGVVTTEDPLSLAVTATMPLQPQVGGEVEEDIETKVKFARDRTRYFREDGDIELAWAYGWDSRQDVDLAELRAFWRDHRKVVPFYLVDTEANILNHVWFTSSLKWVFRGANRWDIVGTFRGVDESILADEAAPIDLKINCGGYPVAPYQADQYFTNGYTFPYTGVTVDSSGVSSPAPDEAYRWVRYDPTYIEYLITGLRVNHPHTVKLHFLADTARTMTPMIQGVSKPNITVPAAYVAFASQYTPINSDASGEIRIRVTKVSGTNATISAIEVSENA